MPSMEMKEIFVTGVLILITPAKIHMANHGENYTEKIPNDLSSAQDGLQFSFSNPTAPLN